MYRQQAKECIPGRTLAPLASFGMADPPRRRQAILQTRALQGGNLGED